MNKINIKIQNLFKPIEKNSDGYHTFDELYEHRCILFIAFLNSLQYKPATYFAWKSKTNSDGSKWEGWFVAGIEDKITYHLPIRYWNNLNVPEVEKGRWDGHTSKEVLERLAKYFL